MEEASRGSHFALHFKECVDDLEVEGRADPVGIGHGDLLDGEGAWGVAPYDGVNWLNLRHYREFGSA